MKTDADRLRWIVRFATTPIIESALPALRDELRSFLLGSPSGGLQVPVPALAGSPATALETLRQTAYRFLRQTAAATGGVRYIGGPGIPFTSDRMRLDIVPAGRRPGRAFRVQSSLGTGFVLALGFLLAGETGERVRDCPECRRLFVRTRRQIYCSRQCTNRATWREYPFRKKLAARKRQYAKEGWTLGGVKKKRRAQK